MDEAKFINSVGCINPASLIFNLNKSKCLVTTKCDRGIYWQASGLCMGEYITNMFIIGTGCIDPVCLILKLKKTI
jgi:hypothetical protein